MIVPLGLPTPATDDALAEELVACGAGHALERLTGPLFPSPRVLLQTAAGLGGTSKATAGSGEALNTALWSQARRALPELGGLEAMEAPDPGLAMGVPTAAFLAQAAILRARGARKALSRRAPALPSVDGAGVERAHQLLLKAGTQLSDQEAKVVLRGYGMPVTRQAVATSASGAAHFADRIGYPVLLKVASPDLRRGRDEDRRWRLEQIETAAATRRAYTQIIETLEQDAPTVRVDGVVVSEHVGAGMDVHCGALRCADGSLVLYAVPPGPGRRRPPLWCPLPLGRAEAHRFAHNVLTTAAAQRALDARSSALATVFLHLERLVDDTGPRLLHVDLGPVRLGDMDEGFVVVDARMTQRPHLEGA